MYTVLTCRRARGVGICLEILHTIQHQVSNAVGGMEEENNKINLNIVA